MVCGRENRESSVGGGVNGMIRDGEDGKRKDRCPPAAGSALYTHAERERIFALFRWLKLMLVKFSYFHRRYLVCKHDLLADNTRTRTRHTRRA